MTGIHGWIMAVTGRFLKWVESAWIWTPWKLTRSCREQGIPGFRILGVQSSNLVDELKLNLLHKIKQSGEAFYVRFGNSVRLIVLDSVKIQQILAQNADCYKKPSFVTALGVLGDGIFSASGKDWMAQRQILGNCFIMKELKEHFDSIKECSEAEVLSWNVLGTKTVNIHKRFLTLTVKLIGHIVFDEHIGTDTATFIHEGFDRYLHNCRDAVCSRIFNIAGLRWKSQRVREDEERIIDLVKQMIKRRKERLVSNEGAGLARQARALDAMINGSATGAKEGMNFTEKQVIDNGTTLLLAGHETTASLLTWTVYLLAIHREWQDRARVEAEGLETLDFKQVSQLKTISMILWESLRLFPPQPVIGRVCVRENIAGGLLIPEKMETITSLLALHCNPDVWGDDAEDFKPKRFANGINKACKNSSAFLPFGMGPRTCIGQSLALLEARVILYFMLKTYSWELSPAYRHAPDVTLTLQPGFGMPIVLTKER